LWLTGSRVGLIAAGLTAAAAVAVYLTTRRRVGVLKLAAIAAAGLLAAVVLAAVLPERVTQASSSTATDIRVELARTGVRMIASHPVFGLGLAEFAQRSGEFSSPRLLATFPPAVHENAHNNFLQVTAELGLLGGAAFVWLVVAALWTAAPRREDRPGPLAVCVWLGLVGFVLTWVGGHPLLVPEAAIPFWIVLGTAAGAAAASAAGPAGAADDGRIASAGAPQAAGWIAAAVIVLIIVTLPHRFEAARRDTNLEHVGIGVSMWQTDDSERYRSATGEATLFVPAGAGFKLRIKPLTTAPVQLDVELDGRRADRILLEPGTWNDLRIPPRTQRPEVLYAPLHLSIASTGAPVVFRVTKVEPIGPAS
jgi:hypothetical protein